MLLIIYSVKLFYVNLFSALDLDKFFLTSIRILELDKKVPEYAFIFIIVFIKPAEDVIQGISRLDDLIKLSNFQKFKYYYDTEFTSSMMENQTLEA